MTLFIITFCKAFIKFRKIFNPFKVIYWQPLWYCPTILLIYIPIFKIWRFLILIILFHIFVISFCISINRVTCSTCNPYSISLSNNSYSSTSVVFKATCHANPRAERNFTGSSWKYFLENIFLKFLNALAKSNVSLLRSKSWYSPEVFISKSLRTRFGWMYSACVISSVFRLL